MADKGPFEEFMKSLPPHLRPLSGFGLRIQIAKRRADLTESLVKKVFGLAKAEADVEKQVAREQTEELVEKVEGSLAELQEHLGCDLAEAEGKVGLYVMELEADLQLELEDLEEVVDEVGAVCVVLMDREIRKILSSLLESFGGLKVSDNLYELKPRYLDQFGINLEKVPIPWDNVVELHEARNCILHNDSIADEKFKRKVKSPILLEGKGERIDCGRKNLDHCVRVFSEFTSFVIKSVEESKGPQEP